MAHSVIERAAELVGAEPAVWWSPGLARFAPSAGPASDTPRALIVSTDEWSVRPKPADAQLVVVHLDETTQPVGVLQAVLRSRDARAVHVVLPDCTLRRIPSGFELVTIAARLTARQIQAALKVPLAAGPQLCEFAHTSGQK